MNHLTILNKTKRHLDRLSEGHWCCRLANAHDAEEMLLIYQENMAQAEHAIYNPSCHDAEIDMLCKIIEASTEQGHGIWVLEIKQHVVAWFQLNSFSWRGYATMKTAEVNVHIRHYWLRKGLATHLSHMITVLAVQSGYIALTAWVPSNSKVINRSLRTSGAHLICTIPKLLCLDNQLLDINLYHLDLYPDEAHHTRTHNKHIHTHARTHAHTQVTE